MKISNMYRKIGYILNIALGLRNSAMNFLTTK